MIKRFDFFLLLFVFFVGACSENEPALPPTSLRESTFKGQVDPLPSPHAYSVSLSWEKVPIDDFKLFRESESEGVIALQTIGDEAGAFVDVTVKERKTYSYFLGKSPTERGVRLKFSIPEDFDSKDLGSKEPKFDPNKPISIIGYRRVYLNGRISTHRSITIRAEELYPRNMSLDSSARTEAPQTPGTNGDDGQSIYVSVDRIYGNFDVYSHGQPGSAAVVENGTVKVAAGKRGKGGRIEVYGKEITNSIIRVWLKNPPSKGAPVTDLSECYPATIRIGTQETLTATCDWVSSPKISGVFVIGTDLYFLTSFLQLFRLKPDKTGIKFVYLGSPFALKDGGFIMYRSGYSLPVRLDFGIAFDGDYLLDGDRLGNLESPPQIYELMRFVSAVDELDLLLKTKGLRAGAYYDVNVSLNVAEVVPWDAIYLVRENIDRFSAECVRKGVKGVSFNLSQKSKLEINSGAVMISRVPGLTIEQILEKVRGE